jgi:hypothetical protein
MMNVFNVKNQLLILVLTFLFANVSFSQITYENGYLINDENQKKECLIKNMDWKDNPSEFKYRLVEDAEEVNAEIRDVSEFGIYNVCKFKRALVNIDRSTEDVNKMGYERNPVFKEEMLFLKVLVEGNASLYIYKDGVLSRFFYSVNDSEIKQLVYKQYRIEGNLVAENNYFRQQLLNDLKSLGISQKDVERIGYNKKELEQLFVRLNNANGIMPVRLEKEQRKDVFDLCIRPGIDFSSLLVKDPVTQARDVDFGSQVNFRLGIEAEFILPFNKGKWALIAEPFYQYYKAEKTVEDRQLNYSLDYQTVESAFGLRHYFFLSDNSKFFLNAACLMVLYDDNSKLEVTKTNTSMLNTYELHAPASLAMGVGYKYRDRYSVEMKYEMKNNIINDNFYLSSDYSTFSIVFGYSLFK